MKNLNFKSLILVGVMIMLSFAATYAQQNLQQKPPKDGFRPQEILRELGLSKEQMQQIRRINGERKQQMDDAQMRFREANRNLDMAIYADNVKEDEIQTRLKEVQLAQAEIIKIRSLTELAVRRVLTPEQLSKFRELREQFMKRMEERRMEERDDMERPPVDDRPFQQRPKNRVNF